MMCSTHCQRGTNSVDDSMTILFCLMLCDHLRAYPRDVKLLHLKNGPENFTPYLKVMGIYGKLIEPYGNLSEA